MLLVWCIFYFSTTYLFDFYVLYFVGQIVMPEQLGQFEQFELLVLLGYVGVIGEVVY